MGKISLSIKLLEGTNSSALVAAISRATVKVKECSNCLQALGAAAVVLLTSKIAKGFKDYGMDRDPRPGMYKNKKNAKISRNIPNIYMICWVSDLGPQPQNINKYI